ncbi:MAG: hypothetical protein EP343_14965 [Deltaproteobacteria bacterium]|nr:MAG: hypothetical protein EP343_14965 [Deltaproteobacteria bacterium]
MDKQPPPKLLELLGQLDTMPSWDYNDFYDYPEFADRIVPPLVDRWCEDGSEVTSSAPLGVFRTFGEAALPPLFEKLHHSNTTTRQRVVWALGFLDKKLSHHIVPKVVNQLKVETDFAVVQHGMQTLNHLRHVPQALETLMEYLHHEDLKLRATTALALSTSTFNVELSNVVLPVLLQLLRGGSLENRSPFLQALGSFKDQLETLFPVFEDLLQTEQDYNLFSTLKAIAAYGPDAQELSPTLLAMLEDAPRETQGYLIKTLGSLGGPAETVVPALLQLLETPQTDETQCLSFHSRILKAISQIGEAAHPAIPKLLPLLNDRLLGEDAARALGSMGDYATETVQHLVETLQRQFNEHAAWALGRIGIATPEVLDVLLTTLRRNRHDIGNCKYVVRSLGKLGPAAQEAVPELMDILQQARVTGTTRDRQGNLYYVERTPFWYIKELLRALGSIEDARAASLVASYTHRDDIHPSVHFSACIAWLRMSQDPEAIRDVVVQPWQKTLAFHRRMSFTRDQEYVPELVGLASLLREYVSVLDEETKNAWLDAVIEPVRETLDCYQHWLSSSWPQEVEEQLREASVAMLRLHDTLLYDYEAHIQEHWEDSLFDG